MPKSSGLWECENLLMTPHCADIYDGYVKEGFKIFGENIKNYHKYGPERLKNVCNLN